MPETTTRRRRPERYTCPVCGERLYLWSRENEDDPYLLSDARMLHHACLLALQAEMAAHGLSDCTAGARDALEAAGLPPEGTGGV